MKRFKSEWFFKIISILVVTLLIVVTQDALAQEVNENGPVEQQLRLLKEKQLPYPESFGNLGLTLEYDQPEGAVLAMTLPDVYILPDSKLYFLVKFWESLQLLWADTVDEKSTLLFYFAEVRLAETLELIDKDNSPQAVKNLENYRGQLSQALVYIQEMQDDDAITKNYNRLEEQVWYQKALSKIIKAEGISDVFTEMSMVFADSQAEKGGIELQEIQ